MAGTATKSAEVYVDRVSSDSNYPQDTGTHHLWRLGASNSLPSDLFVKYGKLQKN